MVHLRQTTIFLFCIKIYFRYETSWLKLKINKQKQKKNLWPWNCFQFSLSLLVMWLPIFHRMMLLKHQFHPSKCFSSSFSSHQRKPTVTTHNKQNVGHVLIFYVHWIHKSLLTHTHTGSLKIQVSFSLLFYLIPFNCLFL